MTGETNEFSRAISEEFREKEIDRKARELYNRLRVVNSDILTYIRVVSYNHHYRLKSELDGSTVELLDKVGEILNTSWFTVKNEDGKDEIKPKPIITCDTLTEMIKGGKLTNRDIEYLLYRLLESEYNLEYSLYIKSIDYTKGDLLKFIEKLCYKEGLSERALFLLAVILIPRLIKINWGEDESMLAILKSNNPESKVLNSIWKVAYGLGDPVEVEDLKILTEQLNTKIFKQKYMGASEFDWYTKACISSLTLATYGVTTIKNSRSLKRNCYDTLDNIQKLLAYYLARN